MGTDLQGEWVCGIDVESILIELDVYLRCIGLIGNKIGATQGLVVHFERLLVIVVDCTVSISVEVFVVDAVWCLE